jgi:hypothetical protein
MEVFPEQSFNKIFVEDVKVEIRLLSTDVTVWVA